MKLEDLKSGDAVQGVLPDVPVTVISVEQISDDGFELVYKDAGGKVDNRLLYRADEPQLSVGGSERSWDFDGADFRFASEAMRIRLAHLFDPRLAVHTSMVEPLPHQIDAVYGSMLPRQPLRFLLADDPGAGKTIMAGLLIKELIARSDLKRCLIVCPGNLVEQWQEELHQRFQLSFEILTSDQIGPSRQRNWFVDNDLVIARLDKLARDPAAQDKLKAQDCDWDLIVCDEAHRMSATFFGHEIRYTKRYQLGKLLSQLTRHLLLLTATPHNGKEEDFQLFLSLLDPDRFEVSSRHVPARDDISDLMHRTVKEHQFTFDGKPLFPERKAHTVPYQLSDEEDALYQSVTDYVRGEFNRAEALQDNKRKGNVGFALTILQRRLASSPEAIYQSIRGRRQRLEARLQDADLAAGDLPSAEEIEDLLQDAPEDEVATAEEKVMGRATAASSIDELKAEIQTLKSLEELASSVRQSGTDTKWLELAKLLQEILPGDEQTSQIAERKWPGNQGEVSRTGSPAPRKLVIFTEHKATLHYLQEQIANTLGRPDAIALFHGGMSYEERRRVQEAFQHDPTVQILLATDAAGEGINLHRAHLMVNYDLPWNPNRLEQRFGRIHRIGQTEVCSLWNLVAIGTREGAVYRTLLNKMEQARESLGGKVFDVLGTLHFDGQSLRDLLVRAIRYGERPDVRERLTTQINDALDYEKIQALLNAHALVPDLMDASRVHEIREDMERAEARRLQPHYIASFFLAAFRRLGGKVAPKEKGRYQITQVPPKVRNQARRLGTGSPVPARIERITFEKSLVQGQPSAEWLCPGHPLLDAVAHLILEDNPDFLKSGAVLVDERDEGTQPRVLCYLEQVVKDGTHLRSGEAPVVSRQMLYLEHDASGAFRHIHYAPYLDYRSLKEGEPAVADILGWPECAWVEEQEIGSKARAHAADHVVPGCLEEVKRTRIAAVDKAKGAVEGRLKKEIGYWRDQARQLKAREQTGQSKAGRSSETARKYADELQDRLEKRLEELKLEAQIVPSPPEVLGYALIVPKGLIDKRTGTGSPASSANKQDAAARAREIIMEVERKLGFEPTDREADKLGYDIESRVPGAGRLRFIEVKGRIKGARAITVTRNEILYSLNKPESYILGIVEFLGEGKHRVHYVREPFQREPDFGVTSVNYSFADLLKRAKAPS